MNLHITGTQNKKCDVDLNNTNDFEDLERLELTYTIETISQNHWYFEDQE